MIGCIYHEADLDGVMSAAIVKKYFKGDIDLLPYNYGKEIPDVNKYDKVFVVDVSFGDRTRFLFDEWEDKGIDVTWIDHHKTAIEAVKDYNVKGKRRIGTAACELTWEYLFDDIETPDVVKLLSAYDVWDHDRFEWSDVMAFQYGMRGYCGLDVDIVKDVLDKADNNLVNDMINNGEAIIEYIVEKNRGEINMFSFEADVFGYKAICMNTTEFNSTTFESMYNPKRHDHSWVKAGPGIQRCAICGITKQSEWRDGKTSHCVYLSSGELYSITGETPECRDLSEFY